MPAPPNGLDEDELALFAEIARRYLERTMNEPVAFEPAEMGFATPDFSDFTGLIRMSGQQEGFVYLTMPEPLLRQLLNQVGEQEQNADMCRDFVGEIAGAIASQAREHFGGKLGLSTPLAMTADEAARVEWPFSHLSIPFTVLGHGSRLGFTLEGHGQQS